MTQCAAYLGKYVVMWSYKKIDGDTTSIKDKLKSLCQLLKYLHIIKNNTMK